MAHASLPRLKLNVSADLFRQLAAMEKAGLPTDKALGLIRLPPRVHPRLAEMRRWLARGFSLAEAGSKSGLFTPLEASLLHAACSAGSPEHMYRRLADHYARQAVRAAEMRSRMMPALALLLIADFSGPLPGLFNDTLSVGGYLLKSLLPLFALGGAAWLFVELPRHLPKDSLALRNVPLDGLLSSTPGFGAMAMRRSVRDFLESLGLLLEAGMPILQALPIGIGVIRNQAIRQQFSRIGPCIESGASFTQAIGQLSFPGRAQVCALIRAGEASGALPEALFRCATAEAATVNRFDDLVAEWVPRLLYTMAAVLIAYGMIGSGAFMPKLPADLR